MELPECCKTCVFLEDMYMEYMDTTAWYCVLNVWWPTKKKKCKKRREYEKVH